MTITTEEPEVVALQVRKFYTLMNAAGFAGTRTSAVLSATGTENTIITSNLTATEFPDCLQKCMFLHIAYAIATIRISDILDVLTSIATLSANDDSTSTTVGPDYPGLGPGDWFNTSGVLRLCVTDQASLIIYLVFYFLIKGGVITVEWEGTGSTYDFKDRVINMKFPTGVNTSGSGKLRTYLPFLPDEITSENITIGDVIVWGFPNHKSLIAGITNFPELADPAAGFQKFCYALRNDVDESIVLAIDNVKNHWMATQLTQSSYGRALLTRARLEKKLAMTDLASLKRELALQNDDEVNPRFRVLLSELSGKEIQQSHILQPVSGDTIPRIMFSANWVRAHATNKILLTQGNYALGNNNISPLDLAGNSSPGTITSAGTL